MNIMKVDAVSEERLTEIEREVIELFVRLADVLSLPRSVGEIYGLLYVSPQPLTLDRCHQRLNISKGSTSQGLKFLRSFGAVKTVYVPGDRKDYYVAERQLRKMVSGFAKEEILPHVKRGRERLDRLRELVDQETDDTARTELEERLQTLENWHRQADRLLPIVLKFMGK